MVATTKRAAPLAEPRTMLATQTLTGAQMVHEALVREGVEVVFGYPGGQVIPLYDALPDYPLHHVLVRHEQAAAHAADGYARATGRVGVCFATSGPGVTNLVTGLATAFSDSSPLVAITGQVPTALLGKNSFQEVDACAITQSVTKANFLVTNIAELAPTIRKAFRLAATGRPGPVLVDLPRDVQVARGAFLYPSAGAAADPRSRLAGDPRQLARAATLLRAAKRPLLLAGGGVTTAGAAAELRDLVEDLGLPVVTTLMGLGGFPGSHPLFFGLLGMHGRAAANRALTQCDLLLAVGTRLGDRTTGSAAAFAAQAEVVHVDVDPAELGKNVRADVPIVGDLRGVLGWLRQEQPRGDFAAWGERLRAWREQESGAQRPAANGRLSPQEVIRSLARATRGQAVIVTDVGQHQLWAAQHFTYEQPRSFLSSGGLGTMGFGLPAALGAKLGRPEAAVWCVCGDGGLQMNSQELATLAQEGAEVKVLLLNNGYLGMVRQWQELFYRRRYSSTPIQGPDFVRLAEAYGLPARRVAAQEEVAPAMRWAARTRGPVLLECVIDPEANVFPMVPPGAPLDQALEG